MYIYIYLLYIQVLARCFFIKLFFLVGMIAIPYLRNPWTFKMYGRFAHSHVFFHTHTVGLVYLPTFAINTVDGRYPANQLRLVVCM